MNTNKPKPKRGRPTIGSRAMTNSERQQRYRQRVCQEAHELLRQLRTNEPEKSH